MTDITSRLAGLSPEKHRLLALKLKQKAAAAEAAAAHGGGERPSTFPASFAQRRMWLLDRLEPGSTAYSLPRAWHIPGPLDTAALERALDELVRRHETLRTHLEERGGEPVQVVAPPAPFRLEVTDLSTLAPEEARAELQRLAHADASTPFALERGPLFRASLVRLAAEEHALLWNLHHAVTDGWSTGLLAGELTALYEAFSRGEPSPLAPLPLQYGDHAVRERERLSGDALARLVGFWRDALEGAPTRLEIAPDRPRPPVRTHRGASAEFFLGAGLPARVDALARAHEATPFMVYLAAFQLLLGRYARQDDVLVGTAIANRGSPEVEGIVGFFVNTLVLRGDLSGDPTFAELLGRVREATLGAFEHQSLPFEKLVEELNPERSLSHAPLVQAVIVLHNQHGVAGGPAAAPDAAAPSLRLEAMGSDEESARFDLSLDLAQRPDGVHARCSYATDLLEEATVLRMMGHFGTLLESAVSAPDAPLSALSMLDAEERAALVAAGSATARYEVAHSLPAMFAEQAARTPNAPALTFGGESVSYAELDARANRLAHHLVKRGARPDSLVGLLVDRSVETVVGILGILKSGAGYLPLDPAYPEDRLAYMLEDSGAPIVVTTSDLTDRVPAQGIEIVLFDADALAAESSDAPSIEVSADSLAYVIYTSGSTGKPKGVQVTHANVVRLFASTDHWFGFSAEDVWTLFHSYAFDFSVWEMWGALLYGGRLVIVPFEISRSPEEFYALLETEGVTVLNQTPSAFRHLMRTDEEAAARGGMRDLALRHVVFGGEALDPATLRGWVDRRGDDRPALVNMYGITETTVHVTYRVIRAADVRGGSSSPIGIPIPDLAVHLLDRNGQIVPTGVVGEMYVGGGGVARGYLNRPELTAERFVRDPFSGDGDARLYRSGDLARRMADGSLEFQGRADDQVKVRGFRIELGEIESVLLDHPNVREAVVLTRGEGESTRLVAWIVAAEEVAAAELRAHLLEHLPEYMVPSAFVMLDSLPLTRNGKVDRRALPDPDAGDLAGAEYVAPRTPTEEALAAVWAELLGAERVGATDGFFALGGHSLLATRLASRLRADLEIELPVRAVFEHSALGALAAEVDRLRGAARDQGPPLAADPRETDLPLSFAQERLWFIDRLDPGSAVYNMSFPLRMRGAFDHAAMERALDEVARRHAVLRTRFALVGGVPVQRIAPAGDLHLPIDDLSALDEAEREEELVRRVGDLIRTPFDLEAGPLFRPRLFRMGAEDHALLVQMHHAVSDGWSMGIFWSELFTLYDAFRQGRPSPLPDLPLRYADFAAWQREWLRGERLDAQVAWWRDHLAGAPAVLELPTDRPRPPVRSQRGAGFPFAIPAETAEAVRALAQREGATPFMVLMAAWSLFLARCAGQDDVVVGTPVAGRTRSETEAMIGLFVNTLAIRTDLSGDPTFLALLARVREATLGAYAHQDLPFERLVEELQPERSLSHTPVFQVMLTFQNTPDAGGEGGLEGLELGGVRREGTVSRVDLTLILGDQPDGRMAGLLEYATDLFEEATAGRMVSHFATLLDAAARAPETPVSLIPLMDDAERAALVAAGSATATFEAASLPALFAEQAARTPNAVALTFGGESVTYAELDARANRLAHHLRKRGAKEDSLVGLLVERSVETVVGILGILKSGAGYLPLDPAYPEDRLAYMLEDSGARIVVASSHLADRLPGGGMTIVRVDADADADEIAAESADALPIDISPESLAYVIYTSGSTGTPKGVGVPHRAVQRLVRGTDFAELGPEQVFLQLAPVTFDASTLEIWAPLLNGGRLVVAPADAPSLREIGEMVRREGVTTLWLTAGLFHRMVDEELDALGSLRQLLAGGDVLSAPHVRRVIDAHPHLRLINGYGPTENTTFTCCHTVRPEDAGRASIPIGRPIANTRAWVLDGAMRPCPVGVPGELYAGGQGLARGYLGRPATTAAAFVPDPFSAEPGARLYRTGDRVRRLEDGTLEFLGRIDQQVKVRGFRIEPGEIETALKALPGVGDAVVVARAEDGGDRRLVAYVVARGGDAPTAAELREALASRLPGHMVPSAFVALDAIPLTANGKVDRRALPAPEPVVGEEAYVAPRTPTEELLAAVWAALLGAARVGVNDSFFALGGHSLLATRLTARIRADLAVELPVRAVFEHATLAALAAEVDRLRAAAGGVEAPPIVPVPRDGDLPLSFAQERLWFVDRMEAGSATYHMPHFVRLEGELDEDALRRAFDELVRRHESLRTRFPLVDGLPMQRVAPPGPADLIVHDFSALREDEKEDEGSRLVREHAQIPFWLETGPLYRVDLAKLGGRDHLLLLTLHHIIADGWSMDLLWRELGQLYGAFSRGEPSPLPEPRVQYGDFAAWQRAWLTGEVLERQLAYWRRALEGAPALLELPTDRPRPAVQTHRGATEVAFLPRAFADAVLALARGEGASLFMVLLSALQLVLSRQSGQEDVVVGTPIAGRTRAETEGVVGLFLNSLALRVRLSGDPTFRELLRRVRETTLDAYAHQDVPFEAVLEEIHPERVLDRTPVFQVMLNLANFGDETAADDGFPGLAVHGVGRLAELASKFDLTLYATESPAGVSLQAVYNPDLFDAERIRALLDQVVSVLDQAAGEPERRFDRFTLATGGLEPAGAARAVRTAAGLPAGVGEPGVVWELRGGEWTKTAERGRYRPDGAIEPVVRPAVSPAAAVPAAAPAAGATAAPANARETGTLAEVLAIWRELLDPSVGPDDEFFDVGGHSLLGVKLLAQVKKRLGVTLPLQTLFASPTPALLAARVDAHGNETTFDHLVPLSPEGTAGGPPLFCMHAAGGTVFRYRALAERLAPEWPVVAVQAKGVTDGGGPLRSVDAMAERYVEEVRRAQPHGPYYLAGWSSGGVVALEVAHRLRAAGEEVALVALFDSSPPDAEAAIPDPVALYLLFAAGFSAKEEVAMKELEDELRELPVDQRLERLAAWLAVHSGEERVHELEGLRSVVEVFRANIGASRRHPLAPYPGRVALFCAEWGHGLGWEEAALPELWRPHVTGELEVRIVPGAHHSLLSEPYLRGVVMALREALPPVREAVGAGIG